MPLWASCWPDSFAKRRRFVVVTTVAAGLSLIPAIAAPDDTATKAVLVGIHLLAAAIIIPPLSQRLTAIDNETTRCWA